MQSTILSSMSSQVVVALIVLIIIVAVVYNIQNVVNTLGSRIDSLRTTMVDIDTENDAVIAEMRDENSSAFAFLSVSANTSFMVSQFLSRTGNTLLAGDAYLSRSVNDYFFYLSTTEQTHFNETTGKIAYLSNTTNLIYNLDNYLSTSNMQSFLSLTNLSRGWYSYLSATINDHHLSNTNRFGYLIDSYDNFVSTTLLYLSVSTDQITPYLSFLSRTAMYMSSSGNANFQYLSNTGNVNSEYLSYLSTTGNTNFQILSNDASDNFLYLSASGYNYYGYVSRTMNENSTRDYQYLEFLSQTANNSTGRFNAIDNYLYYLSVSADTSLNYLYSDTLYLDFLSQTQMSLIGYVENLSTTQFTFNEWLSNSEIFFPYDVKMDISLYGSSYTLDSTGLLYNRNLYFGTGPPYNDVELVLPPFASLSENYGRPEKFVITNYSIYNITLRNAAGETGVIFSQGPTETVSANTIETFTAALFPVFGVDKIVIL